MLKSPRGTSDVLPPDSARWNRIEDMVRDAARRYNFDEIRLPTFEHSELYSRTVGEATDIVEKEMYTFKDRTGRDLTLRPEGTAGVARAFLEHGLAGGVLPRKFYYLGSMFRYEKPQAGRYREHRQFGVEVFGSPSPASDVEVLTLAVDIALEFGLLGTKLYVNSIGCPKCRGAYRAMLVRHLEPHVDELCSDCRSRLYRNPLRVLDCKQESCQAIVEPLPGSLDYLCDECKEHWDGVLALLDAAGIGYSVDKALVRGLDYYTRTVFELKWPELVAGSTVCAGGRYDGLVEELGGPPTPGVGFGMGLDRMLLAAQKGSKSIFSDKKVDVFLASPQSGPQALGSSWVLGLARELRQMGLSVDFDPLGRSVKAQMKHANRMSARFVVFLGEEEERTGSLSLRSMTEGWQKTAPRAEILSLLEEVGGRG